MRQRYFVFPAKAGNQAIANLAISGLLGVPGRHLGNQFPRQFEVQPGRCGRWAAAREPNLFSLATRPVLGASAMVRQSDYPHLVISNVVHDAVRKPAHR
jgi:hypothetical protein